MKTRNKFRCGHLKGFCRRNISACIKDACPIFGSCGECRNYYIPATQEPCRSCKKIKTEA